MPGRNDAAYYWIRAAQELERAEQAANPTVAAVHHDLAYRYGARAAQSGSQEIETGGLNRGISPPLAEDFSPVAEAPIDHRYSAKA